MVEGPHAVEAAIAAGADLETIFIGADAPAAYADVAARAGVSIRTVQRGVLERVLTSSHPQPLAALARWTPLGLAGLGSSLDPATAGRTGPVLVLAGVSDPGNLGTILRSAAATDAAAVVLAGDAVDPGNPKAVRASAGVLFSVPVAVVDDFVAVVAAVHEAGRRVVGLAAGATRLLDDVDLTVPLAVVFGNEARGMSEADVALVDELVAIPMVDDVESINVAMAATVVLFESARQRRAR